MTTLLRLIRSQGVRNGLTLPSKDVKVYNAACRNVSSTPKKNETVSNLPYTADNVWVSYGFDVDNKKLDRHFMHQSFFCCVTLVLVGGAFLLAYLPDPLLRDWAQREAYLQLRYREENGLPLIDPNLIDPSKFTLPDEEELKHVNIII